MELELIGKLQNAVNRFQKKTGIGIKNIEVVLDHFPQEDEPRREFLVSNVVTNLDLEFLEALELCEKKNHTDSPGQIMMFEGV